MQKIMRSWLEPHREVSNGSASILRNTAPLNEFGKLGNLIDRSFKAAHVGIWECTLPDETLRWTDTVFELFELEPQTSIARDYIVSLYSEKSRAELKSVRDRAIATGEGFSLDACIHTAKGNLRWIRITAIVDMVEKRPVRLFGMKQDITAEKLLFEQIRRMTEIDSLTGLASRARFEELFHAMCKQTDQRSHALILIDLDGFKAVNDKLGHQAGDEFLRLTARRLKETAPEALTCARLGGDEFALIHPWSSQEGLSALSRHIATALDDHHSLVGHGLRVSASIGVSAIDPNTSPEEIFLRADRALYHVKAMGKASYKMDLEV